MRAHRARRDTATPRRDRARARAFDAVFERARGVSTRARRAWAVRRRLRRGGRARNRRLGIDADARRRATTKASVCARARDAGARARDAGACLARRSESVAARRRETRA